MKSAQKAKNLTILAALGLFLPLVMPQPAEGIAEISSLERLYWLCSDYQLPVKGFVVEGWFTLPEGKNTSQILKEELGTANGKKLQTLPDGSRCSMSVTNCNGIYFIEVQLITRYAETAMQYEKHWTAFTQKHNISQPLGTTILAEFPEPLSIDTMKELTGELLRSMCTESLQTETLENGWQAAGHSPQLGRSLEIDGQRININLAVRQQDGNTVLYLASPVIYQQY